jgi:hypothetical protein
MSQLLKLSAEVGQFLIPVAAGGYAIYNGNYAEVALLAFWTTVRKGENAFLKTISPRTDPNDLDDKSFLSAYTTRACLGAGFLAAKCGLLSAPTVMALSTADLLVFQRYVGNTPWPTDILFGATIALINGVLADARASA